MPLSFGTYADRFPTAFLWGSPVTSSSRRGSVTHAILLEAGTLSPTPTPFETFHIYFGTGYEG